MLVTRIWIHGPLEDSSVESPSSWPRHDLVMCAAWEREKEGIDSNKCDAHQGLVNDRKVNNYYLFQNVVLAKNTSLA